MAKYIPTKEELENLMMAYSKCHTYSGAAKVSGLSVSIATRIIKEQLAANDTKPIESKPAPVYVGPEPGEPDIEGIKTFWCKSEDWRNEYAE